VALAQESTSGRYVVGGTGGSGVMLRSDPGLDAASIAALPDGTAVVAIDAAGDWLKVQVPDWEWLTGWCNAAYLVQAPRSAPSLSAAASPPPPTPAPTPVPAPAPPPAGRTITALVTGYVSGAGGVGTRTASGTRTHWGTVAADRSLYPFGTRLTIEGFGGMVFVVEDTGGAVHGNVFDVWFPDLATMAQYGTRHRTVTILN
jgi:3D (Asp-Asp-Asp) domain-containing protein